MATISYGRVAYQRHQDGCFQNESHTKSVLYGTAAVVPGYGIKSEDEFVFRNEW